MLVIRCWRHRSKESVRGTNSSYLLVPGVTWSPTVEFLSPRHIRSGTNSSQLLVPGVNSPLLCSPQPKGAGSGVAWYVFCFVFNVTLHLNRLGNILEFVCYPAIARACFKTVLGGHGSPKINLDTKLTAMDATGAKTIANPTSPQADSNGRRSGPGFGHESGKQTIYCLPEHSRG